MTLRNAAITDYAKTKIIEKSDSRIWELGATILEALLETTGFEKDEIGWPVLNTTMTSRSTCRVGD